MHNFENFNEEILNVFHLRLFGHSFEQISRRSRFSASTLRHYMGPSGKWHDLYKQWSAIELRDIHETTHNMMISQAADATRTIIGFLKNGTPSVSLRAAQDILDRCGFVKSSDAWMQQQSGKDIAEKVAKWFELRGSNAK